MMEDWEYHFMRYDMATNAWYHKPGQGAIMKYNYVPTNDIIWEREWSVQGHEYEIAGEYDSEIIFIRYSKNIIDTTPNSSQNIFIQPNKDVFYEVNINEADHYRLRLIAGYEMDYELYDSNFDIVVSDSGNNNVDTCLSLSPGKYYLRINFTSSQSYSGLSVSLCTDYSNDNNINDDTHTDICNGCVYSKVESHNFECSGTVDTTHYEKCSECEYEHIGLTNTEYISFDEVQHYEICPECEYFVGYSNHNFRKRMYSLEEHEVYCTDCGYSYSEAHNFNDGYDYFDTTYHLAYCECGKEARLEHNYTVNGLMDVCENCGVERNHVHSYKYKSNKDGETHEQTCDCGISQTQPCLAPAQSGTIPVCLKCNQKLKGGLIIPFSDECEISLLPNNDEDYIEETE